MKVMPERNAALDVLRGIAIVLVLFNHMPSGSGVLTVGGWTGVDLFFVLSGYLISGLLFRELGKTGDIRIGRFLLRRGMKIWPSYLANYLCWTLWWCGALWIGHHDQHAAIKHLFSVWPNLIFIQNYPPWVSDLWPSSWSLAVEEHFYLVLPVLLYVLITKRQLRLLPYVCIGTMAAVCALRLWLRLLVGYSWYEIYTPSHLRIDALAFGVLIGYLHHFNGAAFSRFAGRIRLLLPVAAIAPIALVVSFPPETSPILGPLELTASCLLYGLLVVAAADLGNLRFSWVMEPLRRLGVFSYTVYLTQSIINRIPGISGKVFGILNTLSGPHLQQVAFFAISIAAGVALSFAVERPFLRMRDRLAPSLPERPVRSVAPCNTVVRAGPRYRGPESTGVGIRDREVDALVR